MSDNHIIDESLNYLADFVTSHTSMAGTIKMYGGTVAPPGWLICNGAAVSRETYAKLFAVIGTTYGAGDGSTTFNVPDLRGRTAIGVGTGSASTSTAHALGDNGGQETHQLTANQLPKLTGSITTRMTGANAAATFFTPQGILSHDYVVPDSAMSTLSFTTGVNKSDRLIISFGNNQVHNNMQPYLAVNYIICTGVDTDLTAYSLDLKTQLKTGTAASVAAGARYTYYFTINDEPGYTPLGIIHVNMTGDATSLASLVSYGMTSDLRGWVTVFNDSTAAHTWTSQVIVLYKGEHFAPAEGAVDYITASYNSNGMHVTEYNSGLVEIDGNARTTSSETGAVSIDFPIYLSSVYSMVGTAIYAPGAGDAGGGVNYTVVTQERNNTSNKVVGLNLYIRTASNYAKPNSSRVIHFHVCGYK